MVRANVRNVVTEMIRYLPDTLSLVVTFYVIFLAMFLGIQVVGDPAAAGESVRYLIVANASWLLLMLGSTRWGPTSRTKRCGRASGDGSRPAGAVRILWPSFTAR